jgi:hypothetical protein
MWVFISVLLVVALMIPIAAILLDSPLGRSLARRLDTQGDGAGGGVRGLEQRVDGLEADLQDLSRSIAGMREELQFVQRLLEDPEKKKRGS